MVNRIVLSTTAMVLASSFAFAAGKTTERPREMREQDHAAGARNGAHNSERVHEQKVIEGRQSLEVLAGKGDRASAFVAKLNQIREKTKEWGTESSEALARLEAAAADIDYTNLQSAADLDAAIDSLAKAIKTDITGKDLEGCKI